jgi:hypothetical protein
MNWDAIGAIAELLGAIGVIASLVYLATQIRQSREQMDPNTRAMQTGSYQQWDDSLQATLMEGVTIPALDDVARTGLIGFEQLNDADTFRFNFWLGSVMRRYDSAYYQNRTGMLDEGRWQLLQADLGQWVTNPGFAQWWGVRTTNLSPEFVALMDEILAEEAEREGAAQG